MNVTKLNASKSTLLVLALIAVGAVVACESETGPDAPARVNGCIDTDCGSSGVSSGTSGSDAGSDAE